MWRRAVALAPVVKGMRYTDNAPPEGRGEGGVRADRMMIVLCRRAWLAKVSHIILLREPHENTHGS